MLRREAAIAVFTAAFISLGYFGMAVFRQALAGNWEAIMSGIIASTLGLIISLTVLVLAGWWLNRDAKRAERREEKRHDEILARIDKLISTMEAQKCKTSPGLTYSKSSVAK